MATPCDGRNRGRNVICVTDYFVTAQDTNRRHRLGSVNHGDHWFRFGKRNYEAGHDRVEPDGVYRSVAQEVVALLDSDAARWWAGA